MCRDEHDDFDDEYIATAAYIHMMAEAEREARLRDTDDAPAHTCPACGYEYKAPEPICPICHTEDNDWFAALRAMLELRSRPSKGRQRP